MLRLLSFLIFLTTVTAHAQTNFFSQSSTTTFSNTPQCAADQEKPANSIFIALDLTTYGVLQINTARKLKEDRNTFVASGNQIFKQKVTLLSRAIIQGLRDGSLPLVQNSEEIDGSLVHSLVQKTDSESGRNSVHYACFQVTEINSYYSNVFTRGLQSSTLENMAKKILDPKLNLHDCDKANLTANVDMYPVLNINVSEPSVMNWNKVGFAFWDSFKTYLSWSWKNLTVESLNEGSYTTLMRSIPVEEQVLLLPNGCKSISRPECSSNSLNSAIVRTLVGEGLSRESMQDIPSTTVGIQDFIRDQNEKLDFHIQHKIFQGRERNEWIKSFQGNYQKFSSHLVDQLFAAHYSMSAIRSQVGVEKLVSDLNTRFQVKEDLEDLYYLCSEVTVIHDRESLSFFKADHQFVRDQASRLNRFLVGGAKLEDLMSDFHKMSSKLIELCRSTNKIFNRAGVSGATHNNFRPWYISYLKRYGPIYPNRESERAVELAARNPVQAPSQLALSSSKAYVQGACLNSVDCARDMMEGFMIVNRVLLFQNHLLKTKIPDLSLFAERQEKVACGHYDPWEASKLAKKKLWADLGSALLFGWSNVPVYIDVNFVPKEMVSFNKLISDGQVKFDYQFNPNQTKVSAGVNLGSLLNIPCKIEISQTQPISTNNQFVFNGVYAGVCHNKKNVKGEMIGSDPTTGALSQNGAPSSCAQCTLSFSQVASLPVGTAFAPIRFGIRLYEAITRYNAVKESDILNPRQFPVSHKHLVETFEKNNGTIPDECVGPLSRGYGCMGNLCESRTAAEFERESGLKVQSLQLLETEASMGTNTGEYEAWLKVEGCEREIRMNVRCSPNAKRFWMSYYKGLVKSCQKESVKL